MNKKVKLTIVQQILRPGQANLLINIEYTPKGRLSSDVVIENLGAVIENINYSDSSKYLIGIGMYGNENKNNNTEIEFLKFEIREFTM
jgi:hypothetical protein